MLPIFGAILAFRDKNRSQTLASVAQADAKSQQILFNLAKEHDPTFASQMRGKDIEVVLHNKTNNSMR